MSRIAQKLCDELVEPTYYKRSKEKDLEKRSTFNKCIHQLPSKSSKPTRSIVVEKKKVINRLVPNDSSASRTKFRYTETLLRKAYVDTAVNTVVTGPLRCDNDCVTLVRKRENKCSCKCGHKRLNLKASSKHIQTLGSKNFSLTDKACAQCIETVNCGTQFREELSGLIIKPQNISTSTMKSVREIYRDVSRMRQATPTSSNIARSSKLNYMGARRWALSQYPIRGPDF